MQHNKPVWLSINLCLSLLIGALTLSGCGGGCVGDACGTYARYAVGGSVVGLRANKTLVLQNNAGDDLTILNNGNFTFPTPVRNFNAYGVTVRSQPVGQTCTVSFGGGTVNVANVSNVVVTCLTQLGGAKQDIPLNLTAAVTTLAGSGTPGILNSTGTKAIFNLPAGITTDGTNLYVADNNNHVIRQINIISKAVTTIAGSGLAGWHDSPTGISATFNSPFGITTDGTNLYVTELVNHSIRQINIISKAVTTIAGTGIAGWQDNPTGSGISATFNSPYGITTDGTNLYVADTNNNVIRQINIISKAVTTIAGSGLAGWQDNVTGINAIFNLPYGITTDGTNLYVADTNNHRIRQINIFSKAVTTIAGSGAVGSLNGTGTSATFNSPVGITTDGTSLYVADSDNNIIRKIVIASGAVTTLAGSGTPTSLDGTSTSAMFNLPTGITSDGFNLFVTDAHSHMIRKIH